MGAALGLLSRIFPQHKAVQLEAALARFRGDAIKAIEFLFSSQDAGGSEGPLRSSPEAPAPPLEAPRPSCPSLTSLCGPGLPMSSAFGSSPCLLPSYTGLGPPPPPPPPPSFLRPPDSLSSLMCSMAGAGALPPGLPGPPGLGYGLQGPAFGLPPPPARFDLKWPTAAALQDFCPPLERGVDFSIKALSRSDRQL